MYEFNTQDRRATGTIMRELLTKLFNSSEVKALCFDIDINYENLGGDGHRAKALSLVEYVMRHRMEAELWNKMATERRTQIAPVYGYVLPEPEVLPEPTEPVAGSPEAVITEMERAISIMQEQVFQLKLMHGILTPK